MRALIHAGFAGGEVAQLGMLINEKMSRAISLFMIYLPKSLL